MGKLKKHIIPAVAIVLATAWIAAASLLTGPLDIPGTHTYQSYLAPIAAATATADHTVFIAPAAVTVTKVVYIPGGANTGQASNYHTLGIFDRGTAGSGTTQLGNDLAYSSSGVADTAAVARTLYSSTTGTNMAVGEVLVIKHTKTGNGVALSEGLIQVQFRPR